MALLVVAVAVGVWGLASSPLFDVDRIEVVGAVRTGDEVVRSASGIERGDVLATVDLGRAGDRVAELPWVAEVSARREWPGTVHIEVEEREAVAAARLPPTDADGSEGVAAWMLLSADGHQLERIETPVEERPPVVVVEGVEPDDEPGSVLDAAVGALRSVAVVPDDFGPRLVALRVVDDGDLEVVVTRPDDAGEIVALLGPPVELAEKMVAVATVVDQADLSDATTINVEVPASPVLTRDPTSE